MSSSRVQVAQLARRSVLKTLRQPAQVVPALSDVEGPLGRWKNTLRQFADLRVGRRRVVRLEAAFDHRAARDRFQRSAVIQHGR